MRLLLFLVLIAYFSVFHAEANSKFSCDDMKKGSWLNIGVVLKWFSSKYPKDIKVSFYFSTNSHRQHVKVTKSELFQFENIGFDTSKPTYLLIHGFKSGGTKLWVLDMKDRLLDRAEANVILVDWSDGSSKINYINAVRNTESASNQIFNFLSTMRAYVENVVGTSSDTKWNHLYFIGHSLGAQVSAQVAHILKNDDFWVVDRITGLDPAKPCFVDVDNSLKLDKDDAKFVDVIHSQVGVDDAAFGYKEKIGDIDFYVNGGIKQPMCSSRKIPLINKIEKMMCSHKLAYKYFTESLNNSCKFTSYHWDGSYEEAKAIFDRKIKGRSCADCPEMGFDAPKSNERGAFLVITSSEEPFCQYKAQDNNAVKHVLQKLESRPSLFK